MLKALSAKTNKSSLPLSTRLALELQRLICKLSYVVLGPVFVFLYHFVFKYHVKNIKQVRESYRELVKNHNGPILVCANHLTRIDSIVHAVVLANYFDYIKHFSWLPWNLPEEKNISGNFFWRVVTYLGKSIYIRRSGGPAAAQKSTAKMNYILARGDVLSIFPEGKRSRDSLVDTKDFSYGVGQLIKDKPNTLVVCVYFRGKKFSGFDHFPQKGEDFYFAVEGFKPQSELKGLRRVKDLSTQVVHKLKQMEEVALANETFDWQ